MAFVLHRFVTKYAHYMTSVQYDVVSRGSSATMSRWRQFFGERCPFSVDSTGIIVKVVGEVVYSRRFVGNDILFVPLHQKLCQFPVGLSEAHSFYDWSETMPFTSFHRRNLVIGDVEVAQDVLVTVWNSWFLYRKKCLERMFVRAYIK